MQVILLEKIRNLGNLGDAVNVKPGYGRNYLIPQSKAVFATPENIEMFKQRRAELEKKAQQELKLAEERANTLNDLTIVLASQASDEGKLYGSVGVSEIKEALMEKGHKVSKREIVLSEGAFHSIGEYVIDIHLHSDVVAHVKLQIVAAK